MYSTQSINGKHYIYNKSIKERLLDPVFNNKTSAKNYADKLNQSIDYKVDIVLKGNRAVLGFEIVTAADPLQAVSRCKDKFIEAWPGKRSEAEQIAIHSLSFIANKQ